MQVVTFRRSEFIWSIRRTDIKRLWMTLALAVAVLPASAQSGKPELDLTVWGRIPVAGAPKDESGALVFFLGEPIRLQMDLTWVHSLVVPDSQLKEWWDRVRLSVSDEHGLVRNIKGSEFEILEARTRGVLVAGGRQASSGTALRDATFVSFTIAPLPPGDFQVVGEMDWPAEGRRPFKLRTAREGIHIRRGDEDVSTRRLFLRKQADAAATYEEFKGIELQLLELEPESAYIYEDLALRSLNVAPPEETRQFYRKAYDGFASLARSREAAGVKLSPEDRKRLNENLARLAVFEKVYDLYVARRGDLRLESFNRHGVNTFAWVRKDGSIVGVLDLHDPTIVRPVDR